MGRIVFPPGTALTSRPRQETELNAALKAKLDIALDWDRACAARALNSTTSKTWAIVGERDSGTNHMVRTVQANFEATQTTPFFKHMYESDEGWLDKFRKARTAWVFMVRDPVEWLMAMYDNHHECNAMVEGRSFVQFLHASPWSSVNNNKGQHVVLEGDSYKNVLELRRVKLHYMKTALDYASQHPETHVAVYIRHQDAAADPEAVLCKIRDRLRLAPLKPEVRDGRVHLLSPPPPPPTPHPPSPPPPPPQHRTALPLRFRPDGTGAGRITSVGNKRRRARP